MLGLTQARERGARPLALATVVGSVMLSNLAGAQARDAAAAPLLVGRVVESPAVPVAGATVGVYGDADTTTTSDSGRFTLAHVSRGPHMLWIRRLGFETTRAPVTIAPGPEDVLTFSMVRTVPLLPTVSTTAVTQAYRDVGLNERMRAGIGQFLTYKQIEERHASTLSQLLDQNAWDRRVDTSAELRGFCRWHPWRRKLHWLRRRWRPTD